MNITVSIQLPMSVQGRSRSKIAGIPSLMYELGAKEVFAVDDQVQKLADSCRLTRGGANNKYTPLVSYIL
jgi:hypothetical protein